MRILKIILVKYSNTINTVIDKHSKLILFASINNKEIILFFEKYKNNLM